MVMTLCLWHCGTLDACVRPCPLWCVRIVSMCVYHVYIYTHVYHVCVSLLLFLDLD